MKRSSKRKAFKKKRRAEKEKELILAEKRKVESTTSDINNEVRTQQNTE